MAQAQPYLVSDFTTETIVKCELEVDGITQVVVCQVIDEETRFHWDTSGLTSGEHVIRARWSNIWGWSDWAVPFGFAKAVPVPVTGLGFEQ